MAAVTSRRPVKYRNHCPKPTLSNISTIAGTPASLEPPAAMKASAVRTERVQRMMRRTLPEAGRRGNSPLIGVVVLMPSSLQTRDDRLNVREHSELRQDHC